mmetsp:Transcript_103390/g.267409  ORF Transcript_103390/g.267409 Transcript_103390/m.267409 type:complete len:201 (+) Transcript_103390:631-1233(+)
MRRGSGRQRARSASSVAAMASATLSCRLALCRCWWTCSRTATCWARCRLPRRSPFSAPRTTSVCRSTSSTRQRRQTRSRSWPPAPCRRSWRCCQAVTRRAKSMRCWPSSGLRPRRRTWRRSGRRVRSGRWSPFSPVGRPGSRLRRAGLGCMAPCDTSQPAQSVRRPSRWPFLAGCAARRASYSKFRPCASDVQRRETCRG